MSLGSGFLRVIRSRLLPWLVGICLPPFAALCVLLAAGGVAPLAGQVEYRWPLSPGEERDAAPGDEDVVALLGDGDLRDQARNLAMTTPAAELWDAFHVAAGLPGWADGACAAVEREIAAGQLGDATSEWIAGAFGTARPLMATALRDQDAGPA